MCIRDRARAEVRDLPGAVERAAAVGAAAVVDLNFAPIQTRIFPRFAEDEYGALCRDDQARDTVGDKAVGLLLEEVPFLEQRCRGERASGDQCQTQQDPAEPENRGRAWKDHREVRLGSVDGKEIGKLNTSP
jgi:hypothetical protein